MYLAVLLRGEVEAQKGHQNTRNLIRRKSWLAFLRSFHNGEGLKHKSERENIVPHF